MSLDVWLTVEEVHEVEQKIYIRESGQTKAITIEEWNEKFPDRKIEVVESEHLSHEVWEGNITHNLNTMAKEAKIYMYLWRPDELHISFAEQLIAPLEVGLKVLKSKPDYFQQFNPENGWGNYDGLVAFVKDYLNACKEYPNAKIGVSR